MVINSLIYLLEIFSQVIKKDQPGKEADHILPGLHHPPVFLQSFLLLRFHFQIIIPVF